MASKVSRDMSVYLRLFVAGGMVVLFVDVRCWLGGVGVRVETRSGYAWARELALVKSGSRSIFRYRVY
jgi:hypothetical protein